MYTSYDELTHSAAEVLVTLIPIAVVSKELFFKSEPFCWFGQQGSRKSECSAAEVSGGDG